MKTASIRRASMDAIVAQAERESPSNAAASSSATTRSRTFALSPIFRTACTPKIRRPSARCADGVPDGAERASGGDERGRRPQARAARRLHSHPDHDAYFSATDRAQASRSIRRSPIIPTPFISCCRFARANSRAPPPSRGTPTRKIRRDAADDRVKPAVGFTLPGQG